MIDVRKMIGNNVKKLRKHNKLSQEKFAEKINISMQLVSKIECGKSYMAYRTLEAICDVFNIQPVYFFKITEDVQVKNDIEKIEVINELLKDLNSEKLTYILEMSKILAK